MQCQLYLPPEKSCPVGFMKEVLAGTKNVFQNHEIVPVKAPRFKELTVARVYDMVKDIPAIMTYIPSESSADRLPRGFFFDVSKLFSD